MGLLKEVAERAVELIGRSAPRDLPQRLIRDVMSGKTHVIRTIDEDDISPAWRGGQFVFHHEVTATAHLKVKAAKRRMRDDVSKDRKRCAPSSALRWCRPASFALEIVNELIEFVLCSTAEGVYVEEHESESTGC